MHFENQRESSNVDDQRGARSGGNPRGGMRLPLGRGGLGVGGVLVLLVLGWFAGIDPLALLNGGGIGGGGGVFGGSRSAFPTVSADSDTPLRTTPEEEALKHFVAQVLATTETCWGELFRAHFQRDYQEPQLLLFRDGVRSACGQASSSVGPFYCPGDAKVYIDLSFLDAMQRTLGAAGDFAQAYVVAHEVGHHVQNLLGTSRRVDAARTRLGEADYNQESVRLELQADYYAGVWAHFVAHRMRDSVRLDVGDYQEAIRAAHAVGDDTLQRRATGHVVPEKFTHGTAEQRATWFRLGYESGDPTAHDPFRDVR